MASCAAIKISSTPIGWVDECRPHELPVRRRRRVSRGGVDADVSNIADLTEVADAITARGHGLDILFVNAGGGEFTALGDITAE